VAISVPEFLLLLAASNQKAGRVGVNGPNLAAANAVSFKATSSLFQISADAKFRNWNEEKFLNGGDLIAPGGFNDSCAA
jgi:hypothetical protein